MQSAHARSAGKTRPYTFPERVARSGKVRLAPLRNKPGRALLSAACVAVSSSAGPAMSDDAAPPGQVAAPRAMSAPALQATLVACYSASLYNILPDEADLLFAPSGWQRATTADLAWYLEVDTQSRLPRQLEYKGIYTPAGAASAWNVARQTSQVMFEDYLDQGILYRGEADSMLLLWPENGECRLNMGDSPEVAALFNSLPPARFQHHKTPHSEWRQDPDLPDSAGIAESTRYERATLSALLGIEFRLAYTVVTSAHLPEQSHSD